jgi:alkaline phosphatase
LLCNTEGPNFPVQWDPRYAIAAGFGAHPDIKETYSITKNGPRLPAVASNGTSNYYANPKDQPDGFTTNGTIPVSDSQGIHSLQDVPIFTKGKPEATKYFKGVIGNTDIFFGMAAVLVSSCLPFPLPITT